METLAGKNCFELGAGFPSGRFRNIWTRGEEGGVDTPDKTPGGRRAGILGGGRSSWGGMLSPRSVVVNRSGFTRPTNKKGDIIRGKLFNRIFKNKDTKSLDPYTRNERCITYQPIQKCRF